ncbi:hypothetical protein NDU88_006005 [Pleurodeles waltl]|uniref:Uncharacterized protein n=1 Tax=Pleurodeles waltl TaxID=8319 RepID=A0AAV7MDR2_PLEWA|nr:hypothetical protein NDU88_006005 [Pleurodeles waltl]
MAAPSRDAGVSAASELQRSRGLRRGAHGTGRVAMEAPGSAFFCLGSPGAVAPRNPLVRRGGRGDSEEDGPPRNLGLKTTKTTTAEQNRKAQAKKHYHTRTK